MGLSPRVEASDLDAFGEGCLYFSGADHDELIEMQILHRDPHRLCELWTLRILELVPHAATILQDEQVKLGSALRRPEEGLLGPCGAEDLLQPRLLQFTQPLRQRFPAV